MEGVGVWLLVHNEDQLALAQFQVLVRVFNHRKSSGPAHDCGTNGVLHDVVFLAIGLIAHKLSDQFITGIGQRVGEIDVEEVSKHRGQISALVEVH